MSIGLHRELPNLQRMDRVIVTSCPACKGSDLVPFMQVVDHRVSRESFDLSQCANCGLVITQHQPLESNIGRYYETGDYISHSEHGTGFMDTVYYTVRKHMLRTKASWIRRLAKGNTLIDIGAGTGAFAGYMQKLGWKVHGFEPNDRAREIAWKSYGLNIEKISAMFEFPQRSADVVTMWHVLEHVHDPEKYLRGIHMMLNDQGILFLAMPNHMSLDARFYKAEWAAWDVPRHLWHFDAKATQLIAERMGFQSVHKYILPFDAFYVSLISEGYRGGGVLRQVRGLCIGSVSLLLSWLFKDKASSIVYVFRKI